ncbi:hypothetical protein BpHYR1_038862 [Brachionus plicatilis]|uniref:Uncharacterized protein n=1 Tax=Brachionus plicatilis TaxID=10195 RepID=A0A3M7RR08_BRAPC|nr:hypothetical protein BpHYR1_038862 [Brachionus plicatilis]
MVLPEFTRIYQNFIFFYANFLKNSKKKYMYFSDLTSRHFSQLQFQLTNLSHDFSNSLIANAASAMQILSFHSTAFQLKLYFDTILNQSVGTIQCSGWNDRKF